MMELVEFLFSLFGYRRTYRGWIKPFTRKPLKNGRRPPIPKFTRRLVKARAGYKCLACGSTKNLEIDHVVPHSWGGSSSIDNLQCLCRRCNKRKSNKSARDYR